ncbi:bifunctional lysylphosphatidylglycerol flippase/synthetase MprF [Burkholderiaceae bacterium FT117]|uniref:bifunctional lysylphosphatidylglycerol flippase/synthetase MprF n=1 Tax=Zeimonas sediminis TaxID=2944268 RepID=UPI0023431BCA|nr:bifunctional lysylphosphatidylglycerol flippase/synthetase MprF [Zeimonas sediminis]MCM5569216.1 bifunctional lysylphosphatidylglycerol flippase/synthetase MprF [Zeimonas sediminis]
MIWHATSSAAPKASPPRGGSWRIWLAAAASLVLLGLALSVLHAELARVHLADVRAAFGRLGAGNFFLALAATAGSYLALTGYDVLALRYLGHALPYRRVAAASFVATAVGHNLGLAMLSAGAVRLRLYTAWGLSAADVALTAGLVGLTFGIGIGFAIGLALLFEPAVATRWLHIAPAMARGAGVLLLTAPLAYLLLAWRRREPLRVGPWQVRVPSPGLAWRQLLLALADLGCAALALWLLLPADAAPPFHVFLGVYVIAVGAGIASHVPGGLGVFESVLLLGLPDTPRDALLAAMVGYRIVYYLLPLALAALTGVPLALSEQHRRLAGAFAAVRPLFAWLAPVAAGATVFVAGAVLLFSGSLPADAQRLRWLREVLPLPVLEVSHLAGSLLGLGLLVLAQALHRRIRLAWRLAIGLLLAAAIASLLKGVDIEEASVSLAALAILWLGRDAFRREAMIASNVLSPASLAAIAAVLLVTAWIGLFAYRHVEYSQQLWWAFAFHGDAPRYLRATLAVMVAGCTLALWRAMQPAAPEAGPPTAAEIERAAGIVARSRSADAALALLGDKRLLFDTEREAFLMYQVRGRSWIALGDPVGDPVGDPAAQSRLAWRLREIADRHAGRAVFYQVDAAHLPLYLDMGLAAIKLGEEATVSLAGFTLEGPARRELRHAHSRARRDGLRFEWLDASAVPPLLGALKEVSDAWLAAKHSREKGFSLGRFDPAYLRRFPCALVRREDTIVAFANVLTGADRHELSVDLMRHRPDAPPGVMDFLFTELMLWGARQGYGRFNLGMAPLAGLEAHPLAPLWHRLGTLIFRHGEHFYNFRGLRAYKAKFDPQWRPRYLAAPGGLALPGVLVDVAALIGGGLGGVVRR